jgi:hypothetical protein
LNIKIIRIRIITSATHPKKIPAITLRTLTTGRYIQDNQMQDPTTVPIIA